MDCQTGMFVFFNVPTYILHFFTFETMSYQDIASFMHSSDVSHTSFIRHEHDHSCLMHVVCILA